MIWKMIWKKEKIILKSKRKSTDILYDLQRYTKEYTLKNIITEGDYILYRNKKNEILLDFPWKVGWKKFYGEIYEKEGYTYIVGRFRVSRVLLIPQIIFWCIVLIIFIYYFYEFMSVHLMEWDRIWLVIDLYIWGEAAGAFVFWVWFMWGHVNEKFENKIKGVLMKVMQNQ